jgi:effector-binding domain-containing protein/uncharacterized protein YndB with AHSA1/START domain
MKFLRGLLFTVIAVIILILVVAIFLPAEVNVSRKIMIAKPVQHVYSMAVDFNHRTKWDPWLKMDPNAETNIVTVDGFIGSKYSWKGNEIGSGEMVIEEVKPNEYIKSSIKFFEQDSEGVVEWMFKEIDTGSEVEWKFSSNVSYPIGRIFGVIMKGMLKSQLDEGLKGIKKLCDNEPYVMFKSDPPTLGDLPKIYALVLERKGNMKDIKKIMEEGYTLLGTELKNQGLEPVGPFFSHYISYTENGDVELEIGVPIPERGKSSGDLVTREYPMQKVVMTHHYGPYDKLMQTYSKMQDYIKDNGISINNTAWEFYLTDPSIEKNPNNWITKLAFPIE